MKGGPEKPQLTFLEGLARLLHAVRIRRRRVNTLYLAVNQDTLQHRTGQKRGRKLIPQF